MCPKTNRPRNDFSIFELGVLSAICMSTSEELGIFFRVPAELNMINLDD